jgi:hypothetical protein
MNIREETAMPRTRVARGWRALLVASALALAPLGAIAGEAAPASAASYQVPVTYCFQWSTGQRVGAGFWVTAQYFTSANTWVNTGAYYKTNANGCIFATVTGGGQIWRLPIWAYDTSWNARWYYPAADHISSPVYLLGTVR